MGTISAAFVLPWRQNLSKLASLNASGLSQQGTWCWDRRGEGKPAHGKQTLPAPSPPSGGVRGWRSRTPRSRSSSGGSRPPLSAAGAIPSLPPPPAPLSPLYRHPGLKAAKGVFRPPSLPMTGAERPSPPQPIPRPAWRKRESSRAVDLPRGAAGAPGDVSGASPRRARRAVNGFNRRAGGLSGLPAA